MKQSKYNFRHIIIKKPKFKINDVICLKLIILSIFIFNYPLREKFCPILKDVNILFYCALSLLLYINRRKLYLLQFWGITGLIIWCILVNLYQTVSVNQVIYFLIVTILPLYILTISFDPLNQEYSEEIIRQTVKFFNSFIHLLFIIFIFDFFSNNGVTKILTTIFTPYGRDWLSEGGFSYRYHFYFAHPLYTAVLVMVYYLANILCAKYGIFTGTSYWKFHFIAAVLLLSTASKAAAALFCFGFFLFNLRLNRFLLSAIMMLGVYFTGAMNFIIERFLREGTGSSGRNQGVMAAFRSGLFNIHLFTGCGQNTNFKITESLGSIVTSAIGEYPVLIYALSYGLLFTFILYSILFFGPIKKALNYKAYSIMICITILFIQINMFNGLMALAEVQIVYSLFLVFCMMFLRKNKYILS